MPVAGKPTPVAAGNDDGPMIRAMVVDDSAVIRGLVKRWLSEDPEIEVVAWATDGESAQKSIAEHKPDVVILDIEMPKMDGITALPGLLKLSPRSKIVMASTLTTRNADIALKALALGASDYLAKPTTSSDLHSSEEFRRDLVEKVRALGRSARMRGNIAARTVGKSRNGGVINTRSQGGHYGSAPIVLRKPGRLKPEIICVGSSTGGPQALLKLFEAIGGKVKQPILITQHMPATFTTILAQHLDRIAGVECEEATDQTEIQDGHVYLAPGGYHMVVETSPAGKILRLNQEPQENFCRPSVDPMLRSVVAAYGGKILTIMLTGMGHDGLGGSQGVVEGGGTIIAQDEGSSVVWGMPGAVATGGLCSAVLPMDDIGPSVIRFASGGGL
ncbi:MAG: chemotaxis response regulator protein-glutamate methylesterase [Proteobacteria bacterium]|nr:chemotaxis response regulator protein-glutamate methylesterase [Pseudomonadota bacterium]